MHTEAQINAWLEDNQDEKIQVKFANNTVEFTLNQLNESFNVGIDPFIKAIRTCTEQHILSDKPETNKLVIGKTYWVLSILGLPVDVELVKIIDNNTVKIKINGLGGDIQLGDVDVDKLYETEKECLDNGR